MKIIEGAQLVRGDGRLTRETLIVEGKHILEITPDPPASLLLNREDVEVFSGEGCYLTPGLIDQHFHGGFGFEFNQSSIAEVHRLLEQLPAYGVTAAIPTVMTAPTIDMLTAINTLEEVIHLEKTGICRLLGIHLEGPFLNPDYRGAHPASDLLMCDAPGAMEEMQTMFSPNLRLVTLAPELDPKGEMIRALRERGIAVSAGHSGATHAQTGLAIEQGVRCITHIFNAMAPLHHREPGIIGAGLNDDRVYTELIADGVHLHPETLRTVARLKEAEKLILISDCLALAGMREGQSVLFGNQVVTNRQGRAINEEGHLAGSTVFLNECFKNMVRWDILPVGLAAMAASTNPARHLGIDDQVGQLEPGMLADMVLWRAETLEVQATWIGGELVYSQSGTRPLSLPS